MVDAKNDQLNFTINLQMLNKNKKALSIILIGIIFSFLLLLLPWLKTGPGEKPSVNMLYGFKELIQKRKIISFMICFSNGFLPLIFALEFSIWKELTTIQKQLFFLFIFAIVIIGLWHIHIEMLTYNFGKVNYHFHVGYLLYLLVIFFIPIFSFSLIGMNKENLK